MSTSHREIEFVDHVASQGDQGDEDTSKRKGRLLSHGTSDCATWIVDGKEKCTFTEPELEALLLVALTEPRNENGETYSVDQVATQRGDAKTSAHYVSDLCDSHERLRRLGEDLAIAMESLTGGNSADDVASLYGPKFLPALLAWRKSVEPPR